jgi:predicted HAD superfamily phosphohydrolase
MCLWLVATELEREDGRAAAGRITMIAPNLWAEGLDRPVREALERKVRSGVADADEALRDIDERGARSGIFRAVVRRLAAELNERTQRAYLASLN